MYKPGEKIIYGSTGVCVVKEITAQKASAEDEEKLYYTLEPVYQSGVIYIPVNSKVFMRPIISEDEANALIDSIPDMPVSVHQSSVLRELEEYYSSFFQSHDCALLMELTRSIYAKKDLMARQNRKFGAVDEKYLKRAEDLLYGELAAALNIERVQVPDYITKRLQGASAI